MRVVWEQGFGCRASTLELWVYGFRALGAWASGFFVESEDSIQAQSKASKIDPDEDPQQPREEGA